MSKKKLSAVEFIILVGFLLFCIVAISVGISDSLDILYPQEEGSNQYFREKGKPK